MTRHEPPVDPPARCVVCGSHFEAGDVVLRSHAGDVHFDCIDADDDVDGAPV